MDLTPNFKKAEDKPTPNPAEPDIMDQDFDALFNAKEDDVTPETDDDKKSAEPVKEAAPEASKVNGYKEASLDKFFENMKPTEPQKPIPIVDRGLPPIPTTSTLPPTANFSKPLIDPVRAMPPAPAPAIIIPPQPVAQVIQTPPSPQVAQPVKKETPAPVSVTPEISSMPAAGEYLIGLLKTMVEKRASDLHLRAGTPIIFRVDGNLMAFDKAILSGDAARDILFYMLPPRQRKIFEVKNEADFSFAAAGIGRFRGNAFRQRGSVAIVLRQIPTNIPTFTDLNLPPVMEKFCKLSRGLVLICGPTGSGKSTALAAMIQQINTERAEHIVTIEDPIEFLYRDNKSIISQRELGTDTISFSEALKHVLRQDPDVVLLGEMRDLETTSTAITAAQTGHLVFSTLHTTDAVQTINRVIDLYPPHQQQQVRYQLADVLKGVVCQRLISHARGVGRVPTCEVLVVTALVKKAIAENKMADVQEAIRQGQYYGMQSFHQSLLKLYKEGQIKLEDALEAASNPEELMMAIRGITQGSEGA